MPRMILSHPETDAIELRVWFEVIPQPEWSGADEDEREEMINEGEYDPELVITGIEERLATEDNSEEWEDTGAVWAKSPLLDEVEEQLTEAYIEKQRERYVDRLTRFAA